jgi:hypothetical protein
LSREEFRAVTELLLFGRVFASGWIKLRFCLDFVAANPLTTEGFMRIRIGTRIF